MVPNNQLANRLILLIDDDPEMGHLLQAPFQRHGAQLLVAYDGWAGLERVREEEPDLVLLDIMMPEMDGWTTIRHIRAESSVPVIMLSAMGRDQDMVRGLHAGADDYVTKPFNPRVLLARTAAQLRRALPAGPRRIGGYFDDGYLLVNLANNRVTVDGEPVCLTPTEFELLAYLVQHQGRTRTFTQILNNVWGEMPAYHTEYVHVYISRLRKKLETDPQEPVYVLGEHGVGYRFS